jgi:hypothetical protein
MKESLDQPTKQSIANLFREFGQEVNGYDEPAEVKEAENAKEEREKFLLSDPLLKKLDLKYRKLYDAWRLRQKRLRDRLAKVRQLFYAKGLTPAVRKKIEELVDEFHRGPVS